MHLNFLDFFREKKYRDYLAALPPALRFEVSQKTSKNQSSRGKWSHFIIGKNGYDKRLAPSSPTFESAII